MAPIGTGSRGISAAMRSMIMRNMHENGDKASACTLLEKRPKCPQAFNAEDSRAFEAGGAV